jgi:hypothetical protein
MPETPDHRIVAPDRIVPQADIKHKHHDDGQHGQAYRQYKHGGEQRQTLRNHISKQAHQALPCNFIAVDLLFARQMARRSTWG